eukprot:UC4_evm2s370
MPGSLRVVIVQAKALPIMDKVSKLTDAYAVAHFGEQQARTNVCPKTLDPRWDKTLIFEVSDEDLQDEPLIIKLWDVDVLSSDDPIGHVSVEVNSLTKWSSPPEHEIKGWFPVYDTLKGIRGQLEIIITLESFFPNVGRFRDTSPRVPFFSTSVLPENFHVLAIRGFVEELIKSDDPEFQWLDRIRTARSSNEARQTLFKQLAGELQRKIGVKAVEAGCNAVVGFKLNFDLEGDSGMVARGIGTAVILEQEGFFGLQKSISRINSENQDSSSTPGSIPNNSGNQSSQETERFETGQSEGILPLITLTQMPQNSLKSLSGVVTARAVKLLKHLEDAGGLDETEGRDEWWNELREEIRGHAKSLGCNCVIGYNEVTSICQAQDICLLSATGTAAVVDYPGFSTSVSLTGNVQVLGSSGGSGSQVTVTPKSGDSQKDLVLGEIPPSQPSTICNRACELPCSVFHCPYDIFGSPHGMHPIKCGFCGIENALVPEFLFCTIDPSRDFPIAGNGVLLHAQVCRTRIRKGKSKQDDAIIVGEYIPFLEYDLYQQLINKMRIHCVNALFGLRIQITVGETLLTAVALATAVRAIPLPSVNKINWQNFNIPSNESTATIMKRVDKASAEYRKVVEASIRNLQSTSWFKAMKSSGASSDISNDEENPHHDILVREPLAQDSRDPLLIGGENLTFGIDVLEMLDPRRNPRPRKGIWICNTENIPGLEAEYGNLREASGGAMITSLKRVSFGGKNLDFNIGVNSMVTELIDQLCFKVRSLNPCKLCNLRLELGLPSNENEVQIVVNAMVVSMRNAFVGEKIPRERNLDGEDVSSNDKSLHAIEGLSTKKSNTSGPPIVQITPMNHIPGKHIIHHLGFIFMPLIKESASLSQRGGMNNFTHTFLAEALALTRARCLAMGGNALVGYRLRRWDNSHTSRTGQILFQLSGDCCIVEEELPEIHTEQEINSDSSHTEPFF